MNTLLQLGSTAIMICDHDWLPDVLIQRIAFDALRRDEVTTMDELAARIVVGLSQLPSAPRVTIMARFEPKAECRWLELVDDFQHTDRETVVMLQLHWRGPGMEDALVSEMVW